MHQGIATDWELDQEGLHERWRASRRWYPRSSTSTDPWWKRSWGPDIWPNKFHSQEMKVPVSEDQLTPCRYCGAKDLVSDSLTPIDRLEHCSQFKCAMWHYKASLFTVCPYSITICCTMNIQQHNWAHSVMPGRSMYEKMSPQKSFGHLPTKGRSSSLLTLEKQTL